MAEDIRSDEPPALPCGSEDGTHADIHLVKLRHENLFLRGSGITPVVLVNTATPQHQHQQQQCLLQPTDQREALRTVDLQSRLNGATQWTSAP